MTAPAITSQIVTFRLGDELFAADIFSVERVLRYTPPTPVPNVPAWIEGVIDYQGRVVPVINLRERFELPGGAGARRRAHPRAHGRGRVGRRDGGRRARRERARGEPSRAAADALPRARRRATCAESCGARDRLVVFLDVARLFSTDERIVLERPSEEPARHG